MKDVFYRGLDSWNKSLSDSITLLMSVVNFIEEQRGDGATSIKQLSDDHLEVANKALGMRDHRRHPQERYGGEPGEPAGPAGRLGPKAPDPGGLAHRRGHLWR